MSRAGVLALLAVLAGCPSASTGTIELGLTAAPGSTVLDAVTRLRVTLTNPRQVVEALRTGDGFKLALEVEATGAPGAIVVEGFDANGALVAAGQSPEFGVAAIDARVVVYMAPPFSVERAPVSLSPARGNASAGALPYGAIFAGGLDAVSGAPSDAVAIYNAYDHTLAGGKALLAPRDGVVVAPGGGGAVYFYGGRDATGTPTGTYWLFDTNVPPSGAYQDLGDHPGFPRADEIAFSIGVDHFVVTGAPSIELQGVRVEERANVAALAPAAAVVIAPTGARTAVVLDTAGNVLRFRSDTFDVLAAAPRPGGAVAALPDARFVVIGGGTADEQDDLLVIDANTGDATVTADALGVPRRGATVAVTARHVVVIGGGTGAATEILDAATLAVLGTATAVAGRAVALPNDQVLIVDDEGGLSLFTPPPPGV